MIVIPRNPKYEPDFDYPELKNYPVILKINKTQIMLSTVPKIFDDKKIYRYPYIKYYLSVTELKQIFRTIKKDIMSPQSVNVEKFYQEQDIKSDGKFYGFGLSDYVVFKCDKDNYEHVKLVDYFQEHCRLKCRRNNQKITAEEWFNLNKTKIHTYCKNNFKTINYENIYESSVKCGLLMCSEFNPLWMASIIKYLQTKMKIQNVLDMSAGRGARLIAAAVCEVNYTGVDPSECTNENYETMQEFFKVSGCEIETIKSGFETVELKKKYDIMFSSPPYFDLEIYETTKTQSVQKFNKLDIWVKDFLYVCMDKIINNLVPGGLMCINIDNPIYKTIDYINPMLQYKNTACKYIGCIQIMTTRGRIFSVWCWMAL